LIFFVNSLKMRFSITAAALVSAAASVKAATFNIQVGANDSLVFNPTSVTGVAAGDVLNFQFVSKNHSVVQSSFTSPCTANGVSSGFQNVSDPTGSSFPTWSLTVENASAPLWFFCSQTTPTGTHCDAGMVFAVNPTANKSFEAFQLAAQGTNATDPAPNENPSGTVLSGTAGATNAVVSVSGSASQAAVTAAASGSSGSSGSAGSSGSSPSGTSTGSASTATTNGAAQLMSGSSISVLAVAGLVAGLIL
jgi:hypothetical protein